MPELRRDPVTGGWVIFSPERKVRPQFFGPGGDIVLTAEDCPFCDGNEAMTPPEVYALRQNHGHNIPGWSLRVVPNKYPALRVEGDLDRQPEGFYDKMNGVGAHEVIIESPEHAKGLELLPLSAVADVLLTFKRRILDLKQDFRLKYIQIFKNQGSRAGATIPHPHSQVIAMPVVPLVVVDELNRAQVHFQEKERCLYCDIIQHEIGVGKRVLFENSDFVVAAPYASSFPFSLNLYPLAHGERYEGVDDSLFAAMAEALQHSLQRLAEVLESPAYNLVLHTAPFDRDAARYFHWYLEIIPIIGGTGGFELGTASYINSVPPEEAVKILKGNIG